MNNNTYIHINEKYSVLGRTSERVQNFNLYHVFGVINNGE